jgi:2-methylcitrate dehydratase PrpD
MDEGNATAKGHPGIHVIPAALALGEAVEATGEEVLTAVIAGYEVGARTGQAVTLRDRFHAHGTWGGIGGAAAAAKLMDYDEQGVRETINIASALTLAPPYQTAIEGATVRNVYAGVSNSTSLLAANLTIAGFTGLHDGPGDVFGTVSGTAFDVQSMIRGLGKEYQIARNYFKLYPCCRHIHACIEAAQKLRAEDDLILDEVERIIVETYDRAALMCASPEAATQLAARFSIPYVVAQTLRKGEITVESFEAAALAGIPVRDLARRVTVREDPALTARRPQYRVAQITVHLRDGRRLTQVGEIDEAGPESQVSPAVVRGKFFRLVSPHIGSDQAERISRAVDRFETLDHMRELTQLLAVQQ